jgi:two-component system cell cycle sensor histidine kinase/response regulator CckA
MKSITDEMLLFSRDGVGKSAIVACVANECHQVGGRSGEVHGVEPGDYVLLTVSDTGVGMDEEVRRRIFEPFFTTKEQGLGTGPGLSMVYGAVQQSQGHVVVVHPRGRGSEVVFVVEDEPMIRRLATRVLEQAGYRARAFADAPTASAAFREDPAAVDLLLADIVMPGGSGDALAEELCGIRPALKVILTSGDTEESTVTRGKLLEDAGFIAKPYSLKDLLLSVRRALDAG